MILDALYDAIVLIPAETTCEDAGEPLERLVGTYADKDPDELAGMVTFALAYGAPVPAGVTSDEAGNPVDPTVVGT